MIFFSPPFLPSLRLILLVGLLWSGLLLGACAVGADAPPAAPSDPDEMYRLGLHYGLGDPAQGIPPDYPQARHWLEQAAAQGSLPATHALAWLYYEGRGVPRDLPQAIGLFSQAAVKGYAESQFMLGLIHAKGEGVERNNTLALQWIKRAADQGHPEARRLLETLFKTPASPPRPE